MNTAQPTFTRKVLAFIIALIIAAALSSVMQSQFNLVAIAALVDQLPFGDWLYTVWFDLQSFAPIMLVILAPVLLLSLIAVRLLQPLININALWLAVVITMLALLLALSLINMLAPMPTLIAASRSVAGSVALALCAAAGAAIYVSLTRNSEAANG
ncbi:MULTISPECIES: hypothetical protein [unclassified Arsukibacterium]|uniref:hypothetical protein n=1 Tax=unclassified Arsukibacterium TaxID=2635278 RepID=UPI000C4CCA69|nr:MULTISPECIES: hypothetical protein [unclassified Arsukibacterium]MAA94846.1 hypothetical protein [Rheinheimera sp.]MBM35065.1 hypothetical protein [Rheinheimera sp.]HAW92385.1 hypothetical protein [Candidatus Azambacteria bacterium]|tara:strand:- start:1722 stop:2189 length:468 start_codon:yes stop_codon:yes gene_type:complete